MTFTGGVPGMSTPGDETGNDNQTTSRPSTTTIQPTNTTNIAANSINSASCLICPGSNINSHYFICISLTNLHGRVPTSAILSGIQGNKHNSNNDSQFSFDALGKPIFNLASTALFNFDDNSSATFKLRDCSDGKL